MPVEELGGCSLCYKNCIVRTMLMQHPRAKRRITKIALHEERNNHKTNHTTKPTERFKERSISLFENAARRDPQLQPRAEMAEANASLKVTSRAESSS